ncbi:hypothetical protein R1sor_007601 [Riccia sorocarpa]|uniref:Uncharacterized protein n=1 Tax=Riccia sorocarpa TaxID=122646 RepID=A0ABD3HV39_9MARC
MCTSTVIQGRRNASGPGHPRRANTLACVVRGKFRLLYMTMIADEEVGRHRGETVIILGDLPDIRHTGEPAKAWILSLKITLEIPIIDSVLSVISFRICVFCLWFLRLGCLFFRNECQAEPSCGK